MVSFINTDVMDVAFYQHTKSSFDLLGIRLPFPTITFLHTFQKKFDTHYVLLRCNHNTP